MTDEPNFDALVERSTYLAEQDFSLITALVNARKAQGLSQTEVEERLNWPPGRCYDFEVYWADPPLSEIRRYALAVNMKVTHTAEQLESLQ